MNNRIEKLLNKLGGYGEFEAALITSNSNRFYFFGMKSSAGTAVIFKDAAYFIIDSRYHELATKTIKNATVILQDKLYQQVNELLSKHGAKTVWIEGSESVATFNGLKKVLRREVISDNPLSKIAAELRAVKDESELKLIKVAQEITEAGFDYICTQLAPGKKERDMALELDYYMQRQGADGLSFETILISGKNTSLPHGVPGDKIIEAGDFVTMDYAAAYGGYCTDMTRTVAIGHVTDEMKKVYNIVLEAQLKALEAIKAGVICGDIDKIARDHIYSNGYEGCFGHSLGHSLGIEIHEDPRFSPGYNEVLKAGTTITVEPGIYLPDRFGVRIEDTVFVTETGIENLAHSPKELIIL